MHILKASVLYFALVFGAGFLLGTVRTVWVAPRVGTRRAELMEAPIMLVVTCCADRLIEIVFAANLHPSREKCAGEHADFTALLDDSFAGGIRLCGEFWLVNLKVQPFEALHACAEFAFADSHAHRRGSSAVANCTTKTS